MDIRFYFIGLAAISQLGMSLVNIQHAFGNQTTRRDRIHHALIACSYGGLAVALVAGLMLYGLPVRE
ncbi:hypothetical protein [Spirosoma oryzicola]|uniref:hypothetical protein n=1 Tax=Spirosoma oryzicola TaxID=2898794 RepID=UPI001E412FC5|nr:hypothetical protein [Spirosoma oryzicola]UHG93488.1 hypothetical protein LQ777_11410 [Spirosoma oryzicola]